MNPNLPPNPASICFPSQLLNGNPTLGGGSSKVDVRLPGKGNSNSHGARPVHLIITMIKWIQTSGLSIKNSLSGGVYRSKAGRKFHSRHRALGCESRIIVVSLDSENGSIVNRDPPTAFPTATLGGVYRSEAGRRFYSRHRAPGPLPDHRRPWSPFRHGCRG